MPIHHKQDAKGHYFQYGKTGKLYRFKPESKRSVTIAYNKALRQTQAIKSSEGRQKKGKGYYTPEGHYVGNPMLKGKGFEDIIGLIQKGKEFADKNPVLSQAIAPIKEQFKDLGMRAAKGVLRGALGMILGHGKKGKGLLNLYNPTGTFPSYPQPLRMGGRKRGGEKPKIFY